MIVNVSLHFSLSLIFLFSSHYVFIRVSSIACFKNGVLCLLLLCFPSICPSIIVVIQELFLTRCPIHAFFSILAHSISIFEYSFPQKPQHFLPFLSMEFVAFFSNVILQKLLFWLFRPSV